VHLLLCELGSVQNARYDERKSGHVLFCIGSNRQTFTDVRIFLMLLKHSLATATVGMSTPNKV
jgi:hypothetical protein